MVNKKALRPFQYDHLGRVGNPNGIGGYVVPTDLVKSSTALLSLGLANEWSFDADFQRLNPNAKIIGVDHTVHRSRYEMWRRKAPYKKAAYSLLGNRRRKEKWIRDGAEAQLYFSIFGGSNAHVERAVAKESSDTTVSIDELLSMLTEEQRKRVFISMDIEGAEYQVITDIVRNSDHIHAFACEFHWVYYDDVDFNGAIEELQSRYSIVHLNLNNHDDLDPVQKLPHTIEFAFVRTDLLPEGTGFFEGKLPREGLDVPNNPDKPVHKVELE